MSVAASTKTLGHRIWRSPGLRRIRRPAFYVATIAFLAFVVFAFWQPMTMVVNGWLSGYAFPDHRVHHVMIGGTLTVWALALLVQLYRPTRRVGAMQSVLAFTIAAVVLTLVASGVAGAAEILIFAVPAGIIALLHPAARDLVPSLERLDVRLLGLAAIGATGFGGLAAREYVRHTTLSNEHVLFGHFEFMLFALASIGLFAILGALKPIGWRAPVYAAASLAIIFGVASLAFPGVEQGSNLGMIAALAVLGWAIAFVALAEYVDRHAGDQSSREHVEAA